MSSNATNAIDWFAAYKLSACISTPQGDIKQSYNLDCYPENSAPEIGLMNAFLSGLVWLQEA